MKKFAIQSILLLAVVAICLFLYFGSFFKGSTSFLSQSSSGQEVLINNDRIKVEVADNQDKRSKGLGGKPSIASDSGMLFVFDKEDKYPFWMKGMQFALDFIWISGPRVVDISENVPAPIPGAPDSSLTIFSANTLVDKVLEVNAGTVKQLNIKVGDNIKLQ